jgi:ribose/xylose/arabinose/galactoside ABC-type transport system permease subunit
VIDVAYVSAAQPTAGQNYELHSIAAVVIGGSLFGGAGTILGSVLGALLMTILRNGTRLAGISPYVEAVILGCVVVGAVYVDNLRRQLREWSDANARFGALAESAHKIELVL